MWYTKPDTSFDWFFGMKKITPKANKINILAQKTGAKEITPAEPLFPALDIEKDTEQNGIGMGVLNDGTPYLNQRGLAAVCGVQNAHIGTISSQWNDPDEKPRIATVKSILRKMGVQYSAAHIEINHAGQTHYCYPADVCLAVLEYYAFEAGTNCQTEARDNFRVLAGSKLRDLIYSQVGYDPTGAKRFEKWHERIALNYQSAPKGHFSVFNESHTIIYELILAGAEINEKFIVDISIGQCWSKFWVENNFDEQYGERLTWPHRYPDSHPQSKSNPQEAWCYPVSALGIFREWLQNDYLEGGKFASYLKGKVNRGQLPPSVAQLAITTLVPPQIEGPK
jgi:hypothetical protein